EMLDLCPVDTICHFINKSWCFMDAYHHGLTGKAADWAAKKHRQHWQVFQSDVTEK
ncbi:hypothetical protein WOLCODRAFT_68601, partial [Wolfiporia cocos MD-104 SS10]